MRRMQPEDSLEKHFRLNTYQTRALKKLGIETVRNLLYHFPARYDDTAGAASISGLAKGDKVIVYGKISKLKTAKAWRKKIPLSEGWIEDGTGRIKAVWFHQPHIAKMFSDGALVKAEGVVSERKGTLYLSNPAMEPATAIPTNYEPLFMEQSQQKERKNNLFPVYPESRGVTSRWFYYTIQKMFSAWILEKLTDPIPADMLKKYNLPTLKTALMWIHTPRQETEAGAARKRFAFEEVFFIQLQKQTERAHADAAPSFVIDIPATSIQNFLSRFPFAPTGAQVRAIGEILTDLKRPHAMSRLLEGDVGSGKTLVA